MDIWAFLSVLLAVTHYGKKHLKLNMKKNHDFPPTVVIIAMFYIYVSSILSELRKSEPFGKIIMISLTSCSVRAEYNKVVHYF